MSIWTLLPCSSNWQLFINVQFCFFFNGSVLLSIGLLRMFISQLIHLFTKKEGSVKNDDGMHWRRGVGLGQQRVLCTAQTGVLNVVTFLSSITDIDNLPTKFVIVELVGLSHYSWCALKLLKSAILEPRSGVQMNSDTHNYYVYNCVNPTQTSQIFPTNKGLSY